MRLPFNLGREQRGAIRCSTSHQQNRSDMTNLTFFKLEDLGEARDGEPLPGRLVGGDPRFKTWDIETSPDGRVSAGGGRRRLALIDPSRETLGNFAPFCRVFLS